MWLPLLTAPFAATARRILLPAAVVGALFAVVRDLRAGVAAGLMVWFVASWVFSFTYGGSSSSVRFWRAAAKYPEAAYQWFTAEECWHIGESRPSPDWSGPFRLYVPSLARMIRVYGHNPDFETSAERFLERVRDHETRNV